MRLMSVTCPECRTEQRLGVELDRRMLDRFAEGVHIYCDECGAYQKMRPEETLAKSAA